jgi:hypothetical protein
MASRGSLNPREPLPLGTRSSTAQTNNTNTPSGAWVEITLNRPVSATTRLLKFSCVGTC